METDKEIIIEEIEALKAIMMDEVLVHYDMNDLPTAVELIVKPATAQNIDEQHVRVTLYVGLPQGYPEIPPSITLRNPRGIDDNILDLIVSDAGRKCQEYLGFPVIYELIEIVREKLTANNTPSCPCAICLFHVTEQDGFTKTPCFHYFHSHCLGRYVLNCEETAAEEEEQNQAQPSWLTKEKKAAVLCPVCREPLKESLDGNCLIKNPPPLAADLLEDFRATDPEIVKLQEKFQALFLHQKTKGGIIDLEQEKNKFLVSEAVADDTFQTTNGNSENEMFNVSPEDRKSIIDHKNSKGKLGSYFSSNSAAKNTTKDAGFNGHSYRRNEAAQSRSKMKDYKHKGHTPKYHERGYGRPRVDGPPRNYGNLTYCRNSTENSSINSCSSGKYSYHTHTNYSGGYPKPSSSRQKAWHSKSSTPKSKCDPKTSGPQPQCSSRNGTCQSSRLSSSSSHSSDLKNSSRDLLKDASS